MKDIKPLIKLSSAQRRVAVERAFRKNSNAYKGNVSVAPEGMAAGIANARNPASSVMPKPMMQQALPLEKPPITESVDPMTSTIEDTFNPKVPDELSVVDQQIQAALIADQLWKDQGGNESLGGQVWRAYMSKSSDVGHLESPRDYFVSRFVRWKTNPEEFKKKHPQEARLLSALNDEFEVSQSA